jgi:hypothetical protein
MPRRIAAIHAELAATDRLPIQVLELHIHDEDVCANCTWPRAIGGTCVCGDWQPTSSLFAIFYTDHLATRRANDVAVTPEERTFICSDCELVQHVPAWANDAPACFCGGDVHPVAPAA